MSDTRKQANRMVEDAAFSARMSWGPGWRRLSIDQRRAEISYALVRDVANYGADASTVVEACKEICAGRQSLVE